jgi:carbamoyl-phosphate synthase large subunit
MVYILEANPRASRTVPIVSKVCNISMARIATQLMFGKKLKDLNLERKPISHYGVKESVFPFYYYPEVDPVLGPEMRSTGEVLGLSDTFGGAFYKAQDAALSCLPVAGNVVFTIADKDKAAALPVAQRFADMGFTIKATQGTHEFFNQNNIKSELVTKMHEKRPNVADIITDGDIQLVINTPRGKASKADDSYIRKAAIRNKIPYVTTMAAALAAAKGIEAFKDKPTELKSLQEYHKEL